MERTRPTGPMIEATRPRAAQAQPRLLWSHLLCSYSNFSL